MKSDRFLVPPNKNIKLKDYSPSYTDDFANKEDAQKKLQDDVAKLSDLQAKLYAQNTYALLIVLQGIDAAGKDGTIKHVMSGVSPSGCQVRSFKVPSDEELRTITFGATEKPERGKIGIFNRSHYEEVIVVRVHPELLARERVHPSKKLDKKIWPKRYHEINEFESFLVENDVAVLKCFLHLSKEEQKKRFLERLDLPDKNWKFSEADVREREYWDDYQQAFEDMLNATSTQHAPWHIVPADRKWFSRLVVADLIVKKLESLDLRYPELTPDRKKALANAKQLLENEK